MIWLKYKQQLLTHSLLWIASTTNQFKEKLSIHSTLTQQCLIVDFDTAMFDSRL